MNDIAILKVVIITAAVFFYIGTILLITKKKIAGHIFAGLGAVLNLGIIGFNFFKNGYVPFVSMYQVLTFLSISFMIMYLYMYFGLNNKWIGPYFTAASGLVLTGVSFMEISVIWHFAPALQSVWFIPHVLSYMLSYALCTVSFLLVIINIVDNRSGNKLKAPTLKEREKSIYDLVRSAYPFMTVGLLFGAIWANQIWGGFWSWDAKENWSLVTWLIYAVYLHCYRRKELRKYLNVLVVLGFIALLITFFGVNLMQASSLHSYT